MRDLDFSIALWGGTALVAAGYTTRLLLVGGARYARVDQASSSRLLGKGMMTGGYWALQPLGKFLGFMGISPNAITWASFAFGIASAYALSQGQFGLGAALGLVCVLCDAMDGMVARAMGLASDAGEVLDAAIDRWNDFLFLAGVAVFYKNTPVVMWVALLAILGSFMVSYATAKAEAMRIEVPGGAMRRPERATYLLVGASLTPISTTFIEPHFMVHPIGVPLIVAITLVAIVSNLSSARRFASMIETIRLRDARRRAVPVQDEGDDPIDVEGATAHVAE